jgi:hypothetical protein
MKPAGIVYRNQQRLVTQLAQLAQFTLDYIPIGRRRFVQHYAGTNGTLNDVPPSFRARAQFII